MAFHKTQRAELVSKIGQLRKQQLVSLAKNTFGGWTPEEEAAHDNYTSRLALLVLELDALDGTQMDGRFMTHRIQPQGAWRR